MNWNKERVNIIYASNDGYACHLAASLVSLMENNRQIPHLDVYVLSVGMCGEYQERLKAVSYTHLEDADAYGGDDQAGGIFYNQFQFGHQDFQSAQIFQGAGKHPCHQ